MSRIMWHEQDKNVKKIWRDYSFRAEMADLKHLSRIETTVCSEEQEGHDLELDKLALELY